MVQKENFKSQSYGKLRKKCLATRELFEDPLFPANEHSLGRDIHSRVIWKRPPELCERPRLFVEKASSKDVTQGSLGNCWFVAACSALATVKALWSVVVPDYAFQEWDEMRAEMYAGIFHFRFWRFGVWIDVVVDDLLPTINNQLIFCHSNTANEFWSALLEKAYAKLCGSYGAMEAGNLCDALTDFTSGVTEVVDLNEVGYKTDGEKQDSLRRKLLKKHDEHALMCCAIAISPTDSSQFESRTKTGLVIGHAYGITAVRDINLGSAGLLSLFKAGDKITLLRLRNPWGAKEWNGPFSDGTNINGSSVNASNLNLNNNLEASGSAKSVGSTSLASLSKCSNTTEFAYSVEQLLQMNSRSPEWTKISKGEKEKLGLTFEDDGEFWIPFEDFVAAFTDLSICHLMNTSHFSLRKTWYETFLLGQWTRPNQAGGCPNHESFLNNPQYYFDIPRDDMELIIQLVQTDTRGQTHLTTTTNYQSIGFHIMKIEENRNHRIHKLKKKAVTSDYVKARSVFFQGTLKFGRHVLLPTTFDPNFETDYMLRVFTKEKINLKELRHDHPEPYWVCAAFCSPPMCVTCCTVKGASGLAKSDNTFCIIKVEGQSLKSEVIKNSQEPSWNLAGVFFRHDVCKPIFVELWERKFLRDKFLGCAVITGAADNQVLSFNSPLVGRGREQSDRHPGELKIVVATYDDLNAT